MRKHASRKDIEAVFLKLMSLFDSEGLYRHYLRSSESPEFVHLFERLGSRSYVELYGPMTIESLLELTNAFDLLAQFVAEAKRVYKNAKAGVLLPPFNFWRPGWDELHLDAAERAVRPVVLSSRITANEQFSMINYGKTVDQLMKLARTGKFDAALRLIKLDPCFLTDKCAERVLRSALLSPSRRKKIVEALSPDPSFWTIDSRKRMLFAANLLRVLSFPGSYAAWFDFLSEQGIVHYANPQTFERACRNLGIVKPYPKERKRSDKSR